MRMFLCGTDFEMDNHALRDVFFSCGVFIRYFGRLVFVITVCHVYL